MLHNYSSTEKEKFKEGNEYHGKYLIDIHVHADHKNLTATITVTD